MRRDINAPFTVTRSARLQVCVLGPFRIMKNGCHIPLRNHGKMEGLLGALAIQPGQRIARDVLIQLLWPESSAIQAQQCLHSLLRHCHKVLADSLDRPLILHRDGYYQLDTASEVAVDLCIFEQLADEGDRASPQGDRAAARVAYRRAVALYEGDLSVGVDVYALVERERLRARYLSLLAKLAAFDYEDVDYPGALQYALQVLRTDPCREDAHRIVMKCYWHLGERTQALRQYRLCEQVLKQEFDAVPERETRMLYDQLRCSPDSVDSSQDSL